MATLCIVAFLLAIWNYNVSSAALSIDPIAFSLHLQDAVRQIRADAVQADVNLRNLESAFRADPELRCSVYTVQYSNPHEFKIDWDQTWLCVNGDLDAGVDAAFKSMARCQSAQLRLLHEFVSNTTCTNECGGFDKKDRILAEITQLFVLWQNTAWSLLLHQLRANHWWMAESLSGLFTHIGRVAESLHRSTGFARDALQKFNTERTLWTRHSNLAEYCDQILAYQWGSRSTQTEISMHYRVFLHCVAKYTTPKTKGALLGEDAYGAIDYRSPAEQRSRVEILHRCILTAQQVHVN